MVAMVNSPDFPGLEFVEEATARRALEAIRWPDGPKCPRRKCRDEVAVILIGGEKQSHRPGLYHCKVCRLQFSVTVGTLLHGSRVPLTGWWRAAHLLSSNSRDAYVSASDIQRALGVTYKSAHKVLWTILDAAASFRGHMGSFGKPIRDHVRKRAKNEPKRGAAWYRLKQRRAEADGLLLIPRAASTKGMQHTERLMTLLLRTDARSRTLKREAEKSADRRSIGLRRTKHANRPKPVYNPRGYFP